MLLPSRLNGRVLIATVLAVAPFTTAHAASISFSGLNPTTGNTVSGSANFTISSDVLSVVLTNLTSGGTLRRGDLLTGIVFDVSGASPLLALTSTTLTDGSDAVFTSKTLTAAMALNGSWTDAPGATPLGQFGAATTGFSGAFSAGGITLGGGGEDYAIAADGTFPAPPGVGTSSSFNSAFPLIQNSLTLQFSGASGLSDSQISNVKVLFGTSGEGVLTPVPEPTSLGLLSLGLSVLACCRWRRRSEVQPRPSATSDHLG
jgi:hypothetical protein